MIKNGTVYIDNSLAKDAVCSTRLVLRHVHGFTTRDDSAILRSGSAGHESNARYFGGLLAGESEPQAREYALQQLRYNYEAWARENVASDDRLSFENVYLIQEEYLRRYGEVNAWPFVVKPPFSPELGFAYPLEPTGHIVLYGRVDLPAFWRTDDRLIIVDHKYTGHIDSTWVEAWKLDSQVSLYYWATQKHFGDALKGFVIGAVELSLLPTSDRKCAKHGVPYPQCRTQHVKNQFIGPIHRTAEQLERTVTDALQIARLYEYLATNFDRVSDIPYLPMEGVFRGACRYCTFREFCNSGRPVDRLEQMFVVDFWQPYTPDEVAAPAAPSVPLPIELPMAPFVASAAPPAKPDVVAVGTLRAGARIRAIFSGKLYSIIHQSAASTLVRDLGTGDEYRISLSTEVQFEGYLTAPPALATESAAKGMS